MLRTSARRTSIENTTVFKIFLIILYSTFTVIRVHYHRLATGADYIILNWESKLNATLLRSFIIYEVVTFFVYIIRPQWLAWSTLPFLTWIRWIGIFFGFIALASFAWVHRHLGTNFIDALQIKEHQILVKTGPYHYVRHPMYTSFFILHIAVFLLTANWFIGITWITGLFIVIAARVDIEEKMMIERFGDEYKNYMKNTGRFLPHL